MQHDIHFKPPIKKFRTIVPQLAQFPADLRPIIQPIPPAAHFLSPYRRRELPYPLLHLRLQLALRYQSSEEPLGSLVDFKVYRDRTSSADARAVGFHAEFNAADDVWGQGLVFNTSILSLR